MAIDRLQSPNFIPIPLAAQSAYLDTAIGKVFEFASIGQQGTISGSRYRAHVFSYPDAGNLVFTTSGTIDFLLLGGGASGGDGRGYSTASRNYGGGGGGAGGLDIEYNVSVTAGTTYAFSVGAGAGAATAGNGTNSTFSSYTAYGGGRGGTYGSVSSNDGANGGSGGGGAYEYSTGQRPAGSATIAGQGNAGGVAAAVGAGGGGGFSSVGFNSTTTYAGARGGSGISINFDGTIRPMAAGGGGGSSQSNPGGFGGQVDGLETGGRAMFSTPLGWSYGTPGNTPSSLGCGGGGGSSYMQATNDWGSQGGAGSNGLFIIRYLVN